MLRMQLTRCMLCTRGIATKANMVKSPSSSLGSSSIYSIERMLKSDFDDSKLKEFYKDMGLPLFLQNVTIALLNRAADDSKNIENLLQFTIDKLNRVARYEIDYQTKEPLQYKEEEGLEPSESLLYLIFKLSLHMNASSVAYTILINTINKCLHLATPIQSDKLHSLTRSFLNAENISLLVDLYSVNRSQDKNVSELNNILTLMSRYNELMKKYYLEDRIFKFTDTQIKSIIDKASYSMLNDTSTSLKKPYVTIENHTSPYGTLELLIKEFGLFISKRVSYSISYYNNQTEDEELERDPDVQELLDRQILSKYLQFCYLVIQNRCKNNDPVTVYTIWTTIKPFHNKLYNATINSENNNLSNNFYYYQTLSKMITLFSKNRRYRKLISQIIFDLPLDSVKVCPELMSSILYHCGRTKNESLGAIVGSRYDDDTENESSDKATLNLKKIFGQGGDLSILGTGEKFTPGQVHAFLSYNLRLGNKKRALEIVEYLKYKLIGFTAIDFNELIRSMLYGDKADKQNTSESNAEIVWSMISNNHETSKSDLNKYALITYLDYMINTMNRKNNKGKLDMARVNEIYAIAYLEQSPVNLKYWNHFYMCYFKYLIRKFPLKVARTVYENNKGYEREEKRFMHFQKLGDYNFESNPFVTKYTDVRMRMDDTLKSMVLRDIYQRSDGYMKRAKQLQSADKEEARLQYVNVSGWVYSELTAMSHSKNKANKRVVHNSVAIDLAKTIDRRSRELGFEIDYDSRNIMSDAERKYRTQKGEDVAIGDIAVEDDYLRSLELTQNGWQNFFAKRKRGNRPKKPTLHA